MFYGIDANKQGDYALRRTGNYFDLIEGDGYHMQPLTFNEFLSKEEGRYITEDDSFMQIPDYIQFGANIERIEPFAREYVVQYIIEEFRYNMLGMQDYRRWGEKFRRRCAEITPAFWSQVNMHDLMMAHELEMDENTIERTNTGNASRTGGQTVITDQSASTNTAGTTSTTQDTGNTQTSDSSTREGNATVIRADGQLGNNLEYDWSDAADNVHEIRSRAGDTSQHMESQTNSESASTSQSHSASTSTTDNSEEQNANTGREVMHMTNKMFMQERQMAIDTAQRLMPLEWLRQSLRPLFYMLY